MTRENDDDDDSRRRYELPDKPHTAPVGKISTSHLNLDGQGMETEPDEMI